MDDVPLKMPQMFSQAVEEDIGITIPDYLSILQETEYEFSLEKWTLAGLQSGFTGQHLPQHSSSSGLQPSCPPYWMMFSSSLQSCLATHQFSNFWEPKQRSCSLNSEYFNLDENDGYSVTQKGKSCLSSLPASPSRMEEQHKKDVPQRSLSALDLSKLHDLNQTQSPSLCHASDISLPNPRVTTAHSPPSMSNNPKQTNLLYPDYSETPPENSPESLVSYGVDSSSEVLAALSPEERELLKAIIGKGYPLQTAIVALQRAGHQTSDQVFSYLVACDHLCQLGYHMAQVEEALEMFQNCETKAEEFLHLLSQFDEMGFQQNVIKEVLLIHENHRERALEELMLRLSC